MTQVDITLDAQQIDGTGYVWTFLDEARNPSAIIPGAVVTAGSDEERVRARVIDLVGENPDRIVHLEILPNDAIRADLKYDPNEVDANCMTECWISQDHRVETNADGLRGSAQSWAGTQRVTSSSRNCHAPGSDWTAYLMVPGCAP